MATPQPTNVWTPTEITRSQPAAWVTQGLLLSVRGSFGPIWPELLDAWGILMRAAVAHGLTRYRIWSDPQWKPFDEAGRAFLTGEIQRAKGQRPAWKVEVVDRTECPELSFEFTDLHPTLGAERASFLLVRLPLDCPSRQLLEIALSLTDALPFWSGTAGYVFNASEAAWRLAFKQIWAWARRSWGIEIVDARASSWDALHGLRGVNWLTFLGRELIDAKLPGLVGGAPLPPHFIVRPRKHGIVVQAGDAPIVGDLNYFDDVSAYAAAAEFLAPVLITDPTPLPGRFTEEKSTKLWIRRFLEPGLWLEPPAA
jgi:hypothetical protein